MTGALFGLVLTTWLFTAVADCQALRSSGRALAGVTSGTDSLWTREELYFGSHIPGGGVVADSAWQGFLDREITPRFPNGFTVLNGSGQYRSSDGTIAREHSRVVIVMYRDQANQKAVEEIIVAYKRMFKQESVLRVLSIVKAKF